MDETLPDFLKRISENNPFRTIEKLSLDLFTDSHETTIYYVVSNSLYSQLLTSDIFSDYFDPIVTMDVLKEGYVGAIFGKPVLTDAYFDEKIIPNNGFLAYDGKFGELLWQRP